MNINILFDNKVITKSGMINPHFTRKVKCGDATALELIATITEATCYLSPSSPLKERIYCLLHNVTSPPLCLHCGVFTKLQYHARTKTFAFTKYCTPKHAAMYRDEQTILQVRKQTNKSIYGCENPMQSETVRDKHTSTLTTKYKNGHPKREHWAGWVVDVINSKAALYYLHHVLNMSISAISSMVHVDGTVISRKLTSYDIVLLNFTRSLGEIQVCEALTALGISYITNDRSTIHKELDIYIPTHNLAIEYCGLYWHSDFHKRITNQSHAIKQRLCAAKGIQLITLFEDEWINKRDIVMSKLKTLLSVTTDNIVGARQTSLSTLTRSQKSTFFDKYHIQGDGPGSVNLGLEHDGTVVACMSFIKQRCGVYYLNRYATSTRVPGGFSKLLAEFKKTHEFTSIVSFADLRWSCGQLYAATGWVLDKTIPPDYCYVDTNTNTRMHKFNFRRKYLPNKLENFDTMLSERENCDIHNIPRLWDCGKLRYVMLNS